jgi:hypothetical protein
VVRQQSVLVFPEIGFTLLLYLEAWRLQALYRHSMASDKLIMNDVIDKGRQFYTTRL